MASFTSTKLVEDMERLEPFTARGYVCIATAAAVIAHEAGVLNGNVEGANRQFMQSLIDTMHILIAEVADDHLMGYSPETGLPITLYSRSSRVFDDPKITEPNIDHRTLLRLDAERWPRLFGQNFDGDKWSPAG